MVDSLSFVVEVERPVVGEFAVGTRDTWFRTISEPSTLHYAAVRSNAICDEISADSFDEFCGYGPSGGQRGRVVEVRSLVGRVGSADVGDCALRGGELGTAARRRIPSATLMAQPWTTARGLVARPVLHCLIAYGEKHQAAPQM